MTAIELLPCPHCGEREHLYPAYRLNKDGKPVQPPYAIDCLGCGHDFTPRDGMDARAAWNRRTPPSQVAPANPAQPCVATFKSQTKETDMPKLTSKIALELVTRIEALNDQIIAVYREANEYDGINNSNVIRDIVKAREEAADQKCIADGILEALDLDEDEE